jgi:hypothetical protein
VSIAITSHYSLPPSEGGINLSAGKASLKADRLLAPTHHLASPSRMATRHATASCYTRPREVRGVMFVASGRKVPEMKHGGFRLACIAGRALVAAVLHVAGIIPETRALSGAVGNERT